MKSIQTRISAMVVAASLLSLVGCVNPMDRDMEQALREQAITTQKAYLQAVAQSPTIVISRSASEVEQEISAERVEQLDEMSGLSRFGMQQLDLDQDLTGKTDTPQVSMNLQRAIRLAVENNMDLQIARLLPAVGELQLTQAKATFDAVYFASFDLQKLDTPQPATTSGLDVFGSVVTDDRVFTTGIRKPMTTGGTVRVQTEINRSFRQPSFFAVDRYYETNVSLTISQPLLRNFGSDINRSQIMLAESGRRSSYQDLRTRLLSVMAQTERAYWDLVYSHYNLMIASDLYKQTREDRLRLKERRIFDLQPSVYTEVVARENQRRTELIRARAQLRQASDALKVLINAPDLPVADETLITPLENPPDAPIEYSLLEAVTTAMRYRPEMIQALLQIKDATVRQRVADNQRLPQLDLSATVRYRGINNNDIGEAYSAMTDGDFIDYLLNVQFEVPIGNRAAEAQLNQSKLERRAAVINYQRTAQNVVREVKDALRAVITTYELIGATRDSRRAAADSLRALNVQLEKGAASYTPEIVDLKLRRQENLAAAQVEEISARTNYNIAMAQFYQILGTLLERNGVDLAKQLPE